MTKPKQFRPPMPRSGTHAIVTTIHNHGPKTIEQGMAIHGRFNLYPTKMRELYKAAVNAGWLEVSDSVYSLTPIMAAYLAEKPAEQAVVKAEVVAPPYHPPFRPLKMIPMPQIREDAQPLRDHSPKTGSVGFHPQNRD